MTTQLVKMGIQHVSLVDRGANAREFAILKRAYETPPVAMPPVSASPVEPGLIEKIKTLLGVTPVAKAQQTFASIVAGRELTDALAEHWTTLQDAMWSAIYAYDADNQPLPLEEKKALAAQNLDEFKAYLLAEMDRGITKSDLSASAFAKAMVDGAVRKVGRKISAARMASLKEAADKLLAVLAEVEGSDEETEKRALPEEGADMTSEELAAAIAKANEPLVARLEAIEKAQTAKAAGEGEENDDPVTLESIAEAIGKLADRVEGVEKGRGQRTSGNGEDATVQKSGQHWSHGIL